MFKRRRAERFEMIALGLRAQLDEQSRELRLLSDAVTSLTVEAAASARESRGLELLIATQLDVLRGRLAAVKELCQLLGERTEMDRLERRRLSDALLEIAREHANGGAPGRRALGVTVFAIADDLVVEPTALPGRPNSCQATEEVGSDFSTVSPIAP